MAIADEMLSGFCQNLRKKLEMDDTQYTKLVPNLYNKRNYVIHSWQLHLCIEKGLKLQKIHRAVEFNQSPWMSKYILLNTELRKQSKTDFEKNMFKLMNNAVSFAQQ